MENECTAIIDDSMISSNLPMNYDIYQKFTKIDIDFKSVKGLEDQEFSKFIKANWRNEKKTIKLSDIKILYHIENFKRIIKLYGVFSKIWICLHRYPSIFCHPKDCQISMEVFKRVQNEV